MNIAPDMRARTLGKVHVRTVTLAHGGGGKAMKDLIDDVFVAAFDNPLLTAVWLTLILGAALVASGVMRVFLGFNMKGGTPWGWVVASGLITLLLGVIILIHWPVSSLYVLGIFLGVDLVFAGATWIGLGLGLRQAA